MNLHWMKFYSTLGNRCSKHLFNSVTPRTTAWFYFAYAVGSGFSPMGGMLMSVRHGAWLLTCFEHPAHPSTVESCGVVFLDYDRSLIMNANVQGNPRPHTINIPERLFDASYHLLVIHDSDMLNIDKARMSLRALSDMVADNAPRDCRVSLDRDQLAFLLDTIADKLDNLPEVFFKNVTEARAIRAQQTQGV